MKDTVLWEFEYVNVPIVVLPFFIIILDSDDQESSSKSVISIVYTPLQSVIDHEDWW